MPRFFRFVTTLVVLAFPLAARAQETAAAPPARDSLGALNLFLDCQVNGCDFDYLRTELTMVNYVRDRTDAQVHVIATSLGTGSGGSEVTLKFIGLREFDGLNDEIKYTTAQGATQDENRKEFVRVLRIGLGRYLLRTSYGRGLSLAYQAPRAAVAPRSTKDPWNFWVFSIGLSGDVNGESQSSSREFSGSLSASRTTEQWKFRSYISGNTERSRYTLDEGQEYIARSHSYYGNGLLVRSLGDHTSSGVTFSGSSSTQQNLDLQLRAAPTIEYDFFTYDQYTRRRLVLSYSLGVTYNAYTDTTIYNKIGETLLDQQLGLSYSARQPWGSVDGCVGRKLPRRLQQEPHVHFRRDVGQDHQGPAGVISRVVLTCA